MCILAKLAQRMRLDRFQVHGADVCCKYFELTCSDEEMMNHDLSYTANILITQACSFDML